MPTKPYDELKFAILERMEEPKLEFNRRLRKELMNGVANGPQPHRRDDSEPDPSQTDSDGSWSTIIVPETGFDTEQSILIIENASKYYRILLTISTLFGERSSTAR
ncbi:unnamed protein product [Hymenolepis diminuta]|uniref:Uncharacterized protein n=1 Tax=Hymenolepis diminuta TaxID=6216 RepID=A0A564XVL5_HYMDI|nr:unnamed protein product [Hymenolepis diminuta]